jgi:hypothetical protein
MRLLRAAALACAIGLTAGACEPANGFVGWVESSYSAGLIAIVVGDPNGRDGMSAFQIPGDGATYAMPFIPLTSTTDTILLFTEDCVPLDQASVSTGNFKISIDALGKMTVDPYGSLGPWHEVGPAAATPPPADNSCGFPK